MKKKYAAGQVSQSFWQKEFGIGVNLFLAGKSPIEMREKIRHNGFINKR